MPAVTTYLLPGFWFFFPLLSLNGQTYTHADNGSTVHFVIRNFGIRTGGDFTGIKGTIVFNPGSLSGSHFDVTVNAATVNTGIEARDKHLRGTDYFDTEKFPLIGFKSTRVTGTAFPEMYRVSGYLTIRGVSKEVQFDFSATPANNGIVFNGEFEINRRDFGVGGNSMVLSDHVRVMLNVLAIK